MDCNVNDATSSLGEEENSSEDVDRATGEQWAIAFVTCGSNVVCTEEMQRREREKRREEGAEQEGAERGRSPGHGISSTSLIQPHLVSPHLNSQVATTVKDDCQEKTASYSQDATTMTSSILSMLLVDCFTSHGCFWVNSLHLPLINLLLITDPEFDLRRNSPLSWLAIF